jgi:nicotinamidase-related amidase
MTDLSGGNVRHIAIDMQRLFAEKTVWHTPVIADLLPNVLRLAEIFDGRTLFAKFMVPLAPHHANGRWQVYYERWSMLTTQTMDPAMQDLIAPLAALATSKTTIEKTTYSIFGAADFEQSLRETGVDTLVFSGVETDVCVLASLFDAVDAGFHVIVASDAVGSSDMQSHAAILQHVLPRMPDQIEVVRTNAIAGLARA